MQLVRRGGGPESLCHQSGGSRLALPTGRRMQEARGKRGGGGRERRGKAPPTRGGGEEGGKGKAEGHRQDEDQVG